MQFTCLWCRLLVELVRKLQESVIMALTNRAKHKTDLSMSCQLVPYYHVVVLKYLWQQVYAKAAFSRRVICQASSHYDLSRCGNREARHGARWLELTWRFPWRVGKWSDMKRFVDRLMMSQYGSCTRSHGPLWLVWEDYHKKCTCIETILEFFGLTSYKFRATPHGSKLDKSRVVVTRLKTGTRCDAIDFVSDQTVVKPFTLLRMTK